MYTYTYLSSIQLILKIFFDQFVFIFADLVLIGRLYSAYAESRYGYPKWLIGGYIGYICLGMILGPFLLLDKMNARTEWDEEEGHEMCVAEYWIVAMAFVVLNDIFMTVSLTYLFVRPLRALSSKLDVSNSNHLDKLGYLSKKYLILSMTVLISGLITIIIAGVFKFNPIAAIDVSINSICLCMFSKTYTGVYENLCGCFLKDGETMRKKKRQVPKVQMGVGTTNDSKSSMNVDKYGGFFFSHEYK